MGNAALARIVGATAATVPPAIGPVPEIAADGEMRLDGVRFGYRVDRPVLHGVDLTLRHGERLALVGASGAGKSTLARLIAGIHPPDTGTVTLGGVPVTALGPEQLRRRVALITQEHHVFAGTLRDNLTLAADGAGDDQLAAALARVGGAQWAAGFPDGLGTRLMGDDMPVTPALAQLIALARLALAAPPILVLDEATSQMDAGAARRAESALTGLLRDRTVVMIAHRLDSARDADRIGVLDRGRLVELGTHAELLERGGAYRRLWDTWHGRAAAAPVTRPS